MLKIMLRFALQLGCLALACSMRCIAGSPEGPIAIDTGELDFSDRVTAYAASELEKALRESGIAKDIRMGEAGGEGANRQIRMRVSPDVFTRVDARFRDESFQLTVNGSEAQITGATPVGMLWGVRDFVHYYMRDWHSGAFEKDKPFELSSTPTINTRGYWAWWHGCYDPYAYIDRASEWKINTVCFWTRGAPLDAEALNRYALDRGVRIWWGYGWGWTEGDFEDANPVLARRLLDLNKEQTKRNGVKPASLCPSDPASAPLMREYVVDAFQRHYAWIPDIQGIYFQTATEAVCECSTCKAKPLGSTLLPVILPALEEMHRLYPGLAISWGVHNRGDIQQYEMMKQIPPFVQLCWEDGLMWASDQKQAAYQMTYRGKEEDYAGVYRMIMNCGLTLRGDLIRDLSIRRWLPRIEMAWNYLEDGRPADVGQNYGMIGMQNEDIIAPCTKNWSPAEGKKLIENSNFSLLRSWGDQLARSETDQKGLFLLIEAGLIDLKMRRVPAMTSELIWNPGLDDQELERRSRMIWDGSVGGWPTTTNEYWNSERYSLRPAKNGRMELNEPEIKSWRWW